MSETPHQLKSSGSLNGTGSNLNVLNPQIPSLTNTRKITINTSPINKKIIDDAAPEDLDVEINEAELAQEYFKEDPVGEEKEDEDTIKRRYQNGMLVNEYESYFKLGVFLKFLFMHLLFFCLLGPFIIILTPIFGWNVLYNQGFVGLSRPVIHQTCEFMVIVSFLLVFYLTDTSGMMAIEVYMILVTSLIRIIIVSSKYAYQTTCFLKMFHNTKMSLKDRQSDQLMGRWRLQNDEIIQEEIQSAILRLEIDSPLFFFNFLGQTSADLKRKLMKNPKLSRDTSLTKNQEVEEEVPMRSTDRERTINKTLLSALSRSQRDIGSEMPSFLEAPKGLSFLESKGSNSPFSKPALASGTSSLFKAFSHFFDFKQLETKCLYGYNLAFELMRNARGKRYAHLGKVILALSVFRALIPTFYRIYLVEHKKEDIPVFTDKPYVAVLIFLINIYYFFMNSLVISQSVQAFKSKIWCFKQIGYMISPKKIHYFKEKKLYPTLNIFDPITLKTWASLRKIMKEYGKKYFLRNNMNITIAMLFYLFIFLTLILQAFGVFSAYDDPLMFLVFGFETLVYFAIFVNVMNGAAFLNSQYKVHKNLLKKNKSIIGDFQKLSDLYVGKDAIKPDNLIYKEGLRVLKDELGCDCFQEKLVNRATLLSGMIDDVIEELHFEEDNEPFTVMGVAINYTLLKSLLVGVASLTFALGQSLAHA